MGKQLNKVSQWRHKNAPAQNTSKQRK